MALQEKEKVSICAGSGAESLMNLFLVFRNLHIPRNVAPSGLPTCLSLCCGSAFETNNSNSDSDEDVSTSPPSAFCRDVLSRNSCVTATPMLANASEVRSQARNVRSVRSRVSLSCNQACKQHVDQDLPKAR